MSRLGSLGLAVFLSLAACPAFAEDRPSAPSGSSDQYYVFDDDPLDAVGPSDRGVRVKVRPTSGRVTLIRPRAHFVRELTRSVENL